jgi:TonB family protein
MRRVWEWCLKYLPEDRTNRYLVVTVILSVLLHILVGVALITGGGIEQRRIAKRGEPLFVDIAPDKPKETAPLGNPSRPVGPDVPAPPRQAAPPVPPAPRAPLPPAAPRIAEAPKAVPKAPSPADKSAEPTPAPKATPPAPAPDQGQTAKAAPQPPAAQPQPPAPAAEQRVASAPPQPPPAAAMFRRGGGGGLKGGVGGIEGDPIALDTPDPKYQDYFRQIRERIQSKWIYPHEAASRGIGGELQIDFGIAKSGELQFIERRRTSGVELLDDYAMRAVQLASPFPPVPDAISKGGLPINGTFKYLIQDSGLINKFLR